MKRCYNGPGRRPLKFLPARRNTPSPSRWCPRPHSGRRGDVVTVSVIGWRGTPFVSVIVSGRRRWIGTRICSWVLRAVVPRPRLVAGRWRGPTHSVIVYIAPPNRGRRIIAIFSWGGSRSSRRGILIWVTSIAGRGWVASGRVLFTIGRIIPGVGRGSGIITRCMNSIDQ